MAKIIIFSAPSGAGKSTVVNYLLENNSKLEFAISATSRLPRAKEESGVHYYFISVDEFKTKIQNKDFVEWEEVYSNVFYGTLKSELERISKKNNVIVFDVDVEGGINLKNIYPEALAVFISPPSIEVLHQRLIARATDSEKAINERIKKAESELKKANKFDYILLNNKLEDTFAEIDKVVNNYIK